MNNISFNPNLITKKMLNTLDERPRAVLVYRFGLDSSKPRTLESIGREYGVTRERVRQIEAFALNKIRQSDEFLNTEDVFTEIKDVIDSKGGIVNEEDFLENKVKTKDQRSHLLFLLVLSDLFQKMKEDTSFHCSWVTDTEKAQKTKQAVELLHKEINRDNLFSKKEVLSILSGHLEKITQEKIKGDVLSSLLKISSVVKPNELGEWGVASSPYVNPRGMRDYAFLVMRRHGSPMHFTETASAIKELFNRKAHMQTVHNELIKDNRFVLVGRGLYALKDWGYEGGVVRNVIEKILTQNNYLPKEEIIKRVLKERYIKENTILVNLQNKKYFKRDNQGRYTLV